MNMRTLVLAAALIAGPQAASALQLSELGLSPEQIKALLAQAKAPVASPGIAFGSPVAFGAGWGEVGVGAGGSTRPKGRSPTLDGGASVVVGVGNPKSAVGLESAVNIISIGEDPGHDGNVNLKLHTSLSRFSAMAVGVENVARWGTAKKTRTSTFVAYSQLVPLPWNGPRALAFNIGLGDNRFSKGGEGTQLFGGMAVFVHPQVSLIADYNGIELNGGVSWVPFRRWPLTINLGAINLTENTAGTEFSGGVGYSFRF
ncbi:hypothetical protein [Stagnimonas aquatica]|nr:hypothetical protein [Stagnimonas aquatica]